MTSRMVHTCDGCDKEADRIRLVRIEVGNRARAKDLCDSCWKALLACYGESTVTQKGWTQAGSMRWAPSTPTT